MLIWLEISKSALIHNLKEFWKIIGPKKVKLMAVVKSNAYGHGLVGVAKVAEKYVDYFGVANLKEALELRKNGLKKPILILSFWEVPLKYEKNAKMRKLKQAITKNIEFCVYTEQQIEILAKISQKIGKKAGVHLEIDTGTSRTGVLPENALNFAKKCLKSPWLDLKGSFTHFAKSEAYNQKYTLLQTERLKKVVQEIIQKTNQKTALNLPSSIGNFTATAVKSSTMKFPLIHAACTAATIVNPATYFEMVRIGIGLYGLWPSPAIKKLTKDQGLKVNLKPALIWKTKIIQVKELPAGTPIGYGCTYKCRRKTKIAVLPVGYWDGYDRKLSNCGEVLIRGRRAPIRGRVCMNMIMVDISQISGVRVGDEVVLIGKQGKEEISAEEIAKKIKTINYEVVTRINSQIPRIYL